jgi:hypothetical protein
MTMNGICVWHERFEGRFRASVDSYQLTRNFLIMAACDELDASIVRAFMMRFSRTFHIYLRSMNYDTCELMLDGLADYLKGPAFLATANGEEILRRFDGEWFPLEEEYLSAYMICELADVIVEGDCSLLAEAKARSAERPCGSDF